MKSYIFNVTVEQDGFEGGGEAFHASCPALKGCHTWGHTYAEALSRIEEAIELYIEDLRDADKPIPVDPALGIQEWSSPAVAVNL